MKQLILDIQPAPAPSLENFVAGRNLELASALPLLPQGAQGKRSLYVWGESGSGKTHLLLAAAALYARQGLFTHYVRGDADWEFLATCDAVALDDVQMLGEHEQIALFNLFNQFRDAGKPLIIAGLCRA